jgi:hypothetical protein
MIAVQSAGLAPTNLTGLQEGEELVYTDVLWKCKIIVRGLTDISRCIELNISRDSKDTKLCRLTEVALSSDGIDEPL